MPDYYTSQQLGPDVGNRGSHDRGTPDEKAYSNQP